MTDNEYYQTVYIDQDAPKVAPYAWIQWKGTDVCMDVHCACGHHGHVDDEFVYRVVCSKCQKRFATGLVVKLIELTPKHVEHPACEEVEF